MVQCCLNTCAYVHTHNRWLVKGRYDYLKVTIFAGTNFCGLAQKRKKLYVQTLAICTTEH